MSKKQKTKSEIEEITEKLRKVANKLTPAEREELLRKGLALINKPTRRVEISVDGWYLKSILDHLTASGVSPQHYSLLAIKLDYSFCCYEGDTPSIKITGNIPVDD